VKTDAVYGAKGKLRVSITDITPVLMFLMIFLFFSMSTDGKFLRGYNISVMANQSILTLVAGLGMLFPVAMGGTDIATGVIVALSALSACAAADVFGAAAALPAAILTGAAIGSCTGVLNAKFKVPSFMVTLAMIIALRALVTLLLNGGTYGLDKGVRDLFNLNYGFKYGLVAVIIAVVVYVYDFTAFGLSVRAIGENEKAAVFAAINVTRVKIMAFIISGLLAGVAGLFTVARSGGVSNTLGASFEMRVMMSLFIGGIPVSGGMGAKIYKVIIGAPMIVMLENGLVLMGVSGAATQGVRGVILLAVVAMAGLLAKRFPDFNLMNIFRKTAIYKEG
jgi:ribose transport system permease protein